MDIYGGDKWKSDVWVLCLIYDLIAFMSSRRTGMEETGKNKFKCYF